ncbi:WD40-repeat-containing domain protein, partial [Thamnocephalis sphaerospora]
HQQSHQPSNHHHHQQQQQQTSYPIFGVRHSRPCNVVTFSDAEPRLLATGLDKVRNDHCLAIWDVEQARNTVTSTAGTAASINGQARMNGMVDGDESGGSVPAPPPLPVSSSSAQEAQPIQQYGMSEAVLSCAWFPKTPTQLVAGMAHKWLRVYDTRVNTTEQASVVIATKAVYGVQVDPFHQHRLASYTEDGIVRIWDVRKPSDAVLTIQASDRSGSLDALQYSPRRGGMIATHGRDSPYIRLWDLQEGTTRTYTTTTIRPSFSGPVDVPVLWRNLQTKPALRPLASFTWIPTGCDRATSRLMSVNRDGVIECVELQEARRIAWDPSGGLLVVGDEDMVVFPHAEHSAQTHAITSTRNPMQAREMNCLRNDISVTMRDRALGGYSMDPEKNRSFIRDDRRLAEVWSWLSYEEQHSTSGRMVANGVDFSYQGIMHIIQGERGKSTSTPQANSPMIMRSETSDYSATLVSDARNGDTPLAPTLKPELRHIALLALGFSDQIELVIEGLQKSGDYERAAAWALFHGKVSHAVAALSESKDEKHRLISTVLAGYNRDTASNTWRDLCKSLSADLDGPYLRAIFGYIASGEWSSVLAITDLPFRDRLGVALRFLSDDEASVQLELAAIALCNADLLITHL